MTRTRTTVAALILGALAAAGGITAGEALHELAQDRAQAAAAATAAPTMRRLPLDLPAVPPSPDLDDLTGTDAGLLPPDAGAPLPELPAEDVDQAAGRPAHVPPVARPAAPAPARPGPVGTADPGPVTTGGPVEESTGTPADPCFRTDPESYEPGGPCYRQPEDADGDGVTDQRDEERIGRQVDGPDGSVCTVVAVNPDRLECTPAP